MNRTQLGLVAAVLLLIGALVFVATRGGPGGVVAPRVREGVLRPTLRVMSAAGAEVPSGQLSIGPGTAIDLRVVLEANAYVYLFDETDNQTLFMWKHADAAPWEKGEYAAEAPAFEGRGEHRLLVVASPTQLQGVESWKAITPDSLAKICQGCEVSDYTLFVYGGDGGGGVSPGAGY
ncbi:MAG: hypothetical protein JNG84_02815 [Archangium sp.]|nr:hypothetical protein [Archangium sp.]